MADIIYYETGFEGAPASNGFWNWVGNSDNRNKIIKFSRKTGIDVPTSNVTIDSITVKMEAIQIYQGYSLQMAFGFSSSDAYTPTYESGTFKENDSNFKRITKYETLAGHLENRPDKPDNVTYKNQQFTSDSAKASNFAIFKNVSTIYGTVFVKSQFNDDHRGSTSASDKITVTVKWHYTYTQLSAPTGLSIANEADPLKLLPNKKIKLKWTATPADASVSTHKAEKYSIKVRKPPASGSTLTSVTSTEAEIDAPGNGVSWYYAVKAISNQSSTYDSAWSSEIEVKGAWSKPSASNFKINNKTGPLYVAATNLPTLKATWEGINGTNNEIKGYRVLKGDTTSGAITTTNLTTNVSFNTSESEATYSLQVYGEYNENGTGTGNDPTYYDVSGASVTVKKVDISDNFTISVADTIIPVDTETSLTINDLQFTNSTGFKNISYKVNVKKANEDPVNISNTSTKPTSIKIPESFGYGVSFNLILEITGTAIDGGTVTKSKSITCVTAAKPSKPVIDAIYDQNATTTDGIQSSAYGTVIIKLDSYSTEQNNTGKSFTFYLGVSTGSQSFQYTKISNPASAITYNITDLPENTRIKFQIRVDDNKYGTQNVSDAKEIIKFVKPTVNFKSYSSEAQRSDDDDNTNYAVENNITSIFSITKPTAAGSTKINYRLTPIYEGYYYEAPVESYIGATNNNISTTVSITFPSSSSEAEASQFLKQLYNTVITSQNPKPSGQLQLKVWYEGFSEAYAVVLTQNISYNFLIGLDDVTVQGQVKYPTGRNYYNPYEDIEFIGINTPNWRGANGQIGAGGTVNVSLTYGSTNFSISNAKAFGQYKNYTNKDLSAVFTLIYTLSFSGAPSLTQTKTKNIAVSIARFTTDNVTLSSASAEYDASSDKTKIAGTLNLPTNFFGSGDYKNIKSIAIQAYKNNNTLGSSQVLFNDSDWDTIAPFELEVSGKHIDFAFKLQVQATNDADRTLSVYTNEYFIRESGATMAIRKGAIGINVNKDYGFGTDGKAVDKLPSAYIVSNSGAAALSLDIATQESSYLLLNTAKSQKGCIHGDDNGIIFDHLYFFQNNGDKVKLESKILTVNDKQVVVADESVTPVAKTIYTKGGGTSWKNGSLSPAIKIENSGYMGWIGGNTIDGYINLSTYTGSNGTNMLYFIYNSKEALEGTDYNSYTKRMTWDGATNTLTAGSFVGDGTKLTGFTSNAILAGNGSNGIKNIATANGAFYATAANAAPQFGTLPIGQGGTGTTTLALNAVLLGNNTSAIKSVSTANGAFYATGTGAVPQFGTLPIGQGGTGLTASPSLLVNLGSTSAANILASEPRPGITGTLAVGNGGTGATTFTSGAALIGNGTSGITTRAITNNTAATAVTASTNLITANTLYYHKGNSNITTVGTITSGTWNGTAIANSYIANLPASKITSGHLAKARLPFRILYGELTANDQAPKSKNFFSTGEVAFNGTPTVIAGFSTTAENKAGGYGVKICEVTATGFKYVVTEAGGTDGKISWLAIGDWPTTTS